MENDLATGYKVSDDRLTWNVSIRDGVKFSDGENSNS
ncbi:ABC transporter substrate-binding protein [Paraclostridium bifermentans]|nr:ABC transporter substrate-binding protein [Paraclostridium bifermentans]